MNNNFEIDFISFIAKSLVEFPEDVSVEKTTDEMGILLTISLNKADTGKLIGREGDTARALRTLLRVFGMKHRARISLKING